MKKQLLSLLTLLLVAVSGAWAQQNVLYAEVSGNTMTLKYGPQPASGAYAFDGTFEWAVDFSSDITTATVDESCKNYAGTTLANLFYYMTNLTAINGLANLNTAEVTTMEAMFEGCQALTALDLSAFNTAKVTNMIYMFNNCQALTALDLSAFNTANVTNMSYMFNNCQALTALDLSTFNTANVTDMSYMFMNCHALTALDLSAFNTANVTTMEAMFCNCQALTALDLSAFNTAKVTNMFAMFSSCQALTALDLSAFNTANVTTMFYMFYSCSALATITVGDGWSTAAVTSSSSMFYDCANLPNYDDTKVDKTNAHTGTGGYLSTPPVLYAEVSGSTMTLKYGPLPASGAYAFTGTSGWVSSFSSNITTATVDESCKNYAGTTLANLFYNMTSLTAINGLANLNTAEVTTMQSMFYSCQALTALDLSTFNTANVTNMFYMFRNCQALTALDLSTFNTAKVTNMQSMFMNCQALTALDLSAFNTAKVTNMQSMFYNCKALTALDLSAFNTANVTNMQSMFIDCQALTALDLSTFNTAKVTSMYGMFRNCQALTTITVGDGWNTEAVTSSRSMFYKCAKLPNFDATKVDKTNAHTGEGGYLTAAIQPYYIKLVGDTDDAANWQVKVGDGSGATFQALPVEGLEGGETVTIQYNGTRRIKSIRVVQTAAAEEQATAGITNPAVGQIIGSDGKNYAADATLPSGVTAVAMIAYLNGSNGLAIQLSSSPVSKNWAEAKTYAEGLNTSTPIAGGTWRLPSKEDWQNMFVGCAVSGDASASDNMEPIAGFKAKIAATGTTWWSSSYWSSTPSDDDDAWVVNVSLLGSYAFANFYDDETSFQFSVLGCLAFTAEQGAAEEQQEQAVTTATPLTMECLTDGTIVVAIGGTLTTGMQWAKNGGEKTKITGTTTIDGLKAGDKVQFYGVGTSTTDYGDNVEVKIAGGTATVKVYGNIMSLLDEENFATKTDLPNSNYVFYGLFYGNANLTDASGLLLPATTLAEDCYSNMFAYCSSLTAAPALPATTLAKYCYYSMFAYCTALTAAPELPATTLASNCYYYMFYNCSKLTSVTCKATDISAADCLNSWLYNAGTEATSPTLYVDPTMVSNTDWNNADFIVTAIPGN